MSIVYVSRCRAGYGRSVRRRHHLSVPSALKSDMLSVAVRSIHTTGSYEVFWSWVEAQRKLGELEGVNVKQWLESRKEVVVGLAAEEDDRLEKLPKLLLV